MPDTTHSLSPLWAEIRAELRGIRETRAIRKDLARDLATYTSPRDLDDLDAMIARYDEDQTTHIRHVLNSRRAA